MFAGSVQGNRSGFATSWLAGALGVVTASRSRLTAALLAVALIVGLGGLALFKGAEIAELVARGSKVLGESASAAGSSPLAKSMAALLGQRSPGERTQGELANDKKRYTAQPKQRALGKIRPALPAPFVKALTNPVPEIVPEAPLLAQNPLVPTTVPAAVGSPPVFVGGGGGGGGGARSARCRSRWSIC